MTTQQITFKDLKLASSIQKALEAEKYFNPTPIQEQADSSPAARERFARLCPDRDR